MLGWCLNKDDMPERRCPSMYEQSTALLECSATHCRELLQTRYMLGPSRIGGSGLHGWLHDECTELQILSVNDELSS